MRAYTPTDAEDAVRRALAGQGSAVDAEILVDLFRRASGKAADRSAANARDGFEREANALAAIVADLMGGAHPDDVVDDLPHDARRRVLAYRHRNGPYAGIGSRDQFGPLPTVPPRDSVMRDRVRTIDVEIVDEDPDRLTIEGFVAAVVDEPL